jgi:glycosyltransferase involved in cell wall biosynthesis
MGYGGKAMNFKPTIVIVAQDVGGRGGMELHLEEMINRLKQEAHVVVVASTLKLADKEGIRYVHIPTMRRPAPLRHLLFALLASIRVLFIKRDILHTTGAIIFNRAEASTVHFCHAGFTKETGDTRAKDQRSRLRRLNSAMETKIALLLERIIYKPNRTAKLIAVSNRVKGELLASFPYGPEEVQVIPNGVDTAAFKPYRSEEKQTLRAALGLPEHGRILLFMGGDWPRKGLDLLIQAFNGIAGDFKDVSLVIVGKGDQLAYNHAVSPAYRKRVYFAGKQNNPQEWFGASDLFVFPSSYETFSLVVHEAAAAGLTVLSTRVGGVEDLIEDQVDGYYVDRDAEQIQRVLRHALTSGESAECGERARRKVLKLTWHSTYEQMKSLYQELLQGRNKDQLKGSRGFGYEHSN